MGDFWVFGYGSLIWRPGFAHVETRRARLYGYRRSLCVYSFVHRGTRERPGLVLGLDRGGSCIGLAFRVPGELRDEVLAYLRERELVTSVYLERSLDIRLDRWHERRRDGERGRLYRRPRSMSSMPAGSTRRMQLSIVRGAVGQSGRNEDYVLSTLEHLEALGISDHWLEEVARRLAPL